MRTPVRSLALLSGLRTWRSVGHRLGSKPLLLWLWCRPVATALILTPSLGTSICRECDPRKGKKIKKKKKGTIVYVVPRCKISLLLKTFPDIQPWNLENLTFFELLSCPSETSICPPPCLCFIKSHLHVSKNSTLKEV